VTKFENFFARYEEGANSFDPDLVCSLYTTEFLGGGPSGVMCGRNDESLRKFIVHRQAFFQQIGFKRAKILSVEETPLDERYTMAKVRWRMTFEKQPGHPLDFEFYLTYFLFDPGSGPKVVFWISHDDEQRVMQESGLISAEAEAGAAPDLARM
jgi:hypothetical protein